MSTQFPIDIDSAQAQWIPNPPSYPFSLPSAATQNKTWSPSLISGLSLWLDASDASTITGSSPITNWTDKSGTGRTVTFAGPNNTYSALYQSVATDRDTTSYFYANLNLIKSQVPNASLFIVYNWLASSVNPSDQGLFGQEVGGGTNRFQLLRFDAGISSYGFFYTSSSPYYAVVNSLATPNRLLYSATFAYGSAGGTYVTVNGTTATSSLTEGPASPETTSTNTYFGNINNEYNFSASVAFNEIIAFSKELTEAELQQVQGYLAWKWGLQGDLPAEHPYKNAAPVNASPSGAILPNSGISASISNRKWTPPNVSDLALWLDGADTNTLTLSGTNVTTWLDKSGNDRNATVDGTSYATYDAVARGLLFNNSVYNTTLSGDPTNETMFIVFNYTGAYPNIMMVCSAGVGGRFAGVFNYEIQVGIGIDSVAWGPTTPFTQNAIQLFTSQIVSATSSSVSVNASTPVVGSALTFTSGTNTRLGVTAPGTLNYNGYMYEIVVYNSVLTASQIEKVQGYLAWKWRIQGSLPWSHPYRLYPPPPESPQASVFIFSYTGSAQTFLVPGGVSSIQVYLWGAGGGGYGATDGGQFNGGAGAFVSGTLTVTPGSTLSIIVGRGGIVNDEVGGTLEQGGGGPAGIPAAGASSGGGRSAIRLSGNDIVTAGGGSGSAWVAGSAATWFGTSNPGSTYVGGGGGTQSAGGAAGYTDGYNPSGPGSQGQGGNGAGYGSGGGGGWYGGGGGGTVPGLGGPGGAGSSYIDLLTGSTGESGSVPDAPGTTSPYYANNAGRGGQSGSTSGGNGLIVIVL